MAAEPGDRLRLYYRYRGGYTSAMADETTGGGRFGGRYEWEEEPDLTSLSEDALRELLKGLAEEERAVSYHRRVLQGRIDLIRAELVRRGGVALSPEELARVLLGSGVSREAGGEDRRGDPPGMGGAL